MGPRSEFPVPLQKQIKQDVELLKEWIAKEPHLPKIEDEKWLETFLHHNKFSLEKTKFKLERYYSLRTKYPEILKNRDPTSPDMLLSAKCVKIGLAEKLTEDGVGLFCVKVESNAEAFDMTALAKRIFMSFDTMLLKEENRLIDFITIFEFRDLRYLHVLKILAGIVKVVEIFNDGYMERCRAVHLVNFPSFAQKPYELMFKLLPKKIRERHHIHTATKSTLFEMVDRDIVCKDFGGNGPSLDKLADGTQQVLERYRKWFEEQESVCSDEALRRSDFDQIEEMKGSFRKLEVD